MHKSIAFLLGLTAVSAGTVFLNDATVGDIIPPAIFDSIQFLDGLALSITKHDIEADLERCYTNATTVKDDIEHAMRDFSIGGVLGYVSGALRTIKLIDEIPTFFNGCDDAGTAIETLVSWAQVQLNDTTALEERITKNFLWDHTEIVTDIEAGLGDYNKTDYFDSGIEIGKAVMLLTQ